MPRVKRPTARSFVEILAGLAVISLVWLVFRSDVVTAFATLVICGGYVAWTFWDNRYK